MTTGSSEREPCPVCLSREFRTLSDPWRGRSLLSDMRTVEQPMNRVACLRCGLVTRGVLPGIEEQRSVYDEAYALFAEAPTGHARQRQAAIAQWIMTALGDFHPGRLLEFGCGDGSLLEALGAAFPGASLCGIEPAPRSVREARRRGVQVLQGFGEEPPAGLADLCVSVNVIEHVSDPVAFLRSMCQAAAPGGRIALVCPDGNVPNYELLFYDHLYSFSRNALELLCARAGLIVRSSEQAPAAIGPFQIVIAEPAPDAGRAPPAVDPDGVRIAAMKHAYLGAWAGLEGILQERIGDAPRVVVFGNGDVAALLRIYAPAVWSAVEACVVDGAPAAKSFLDRPLCGYDSLSRPEVMGLGVRPGSQDGLAGRLAQDGHRVVRWNDVVGA